GQMGFCDVIFGWDSADVLYDNVEVTGWHSGYPDLDCTIDPTSFRRVPWDGDLPFFLLDFQLPTGEPHPASPRQLLQRVTQRAADMGFSATMSGEYEFFLFKEDSHSVRAK